MAQFIMHTSDTAPVESKPLIAASEKAFGRLPGLHAVMAEAPGLLEGYQKLHQLFLEELVQRKRLSCGRQSMSNMLVITVSRRIRALPMR